MSWGDFTLCSCPDLWNNDERDRALDNPTFDSGSGTWRRLDLFISLQTPLQEEVLDEADNINGRELDLRDLIPGSWWSGHNYCRG